MSKDSGFSRERQCSKCGVRFMCKTKTRFQCYECRPQWKGMGRQKSKNPLIVDQDPNELDFMLRQVEEQILLPNPKSENSSIPMNLDSQRKPPPTEVQQNPNNPDNYFRNNPVKKYGRLVHNSQGHTVFWPRRPQEGWGQCFWKGAPEKESWVRRCTRERFSGKSSYCYTHIEWWIERRAEIRNERVRLEERKKPEAFAEADFLITTSKEALAFLSRINYYVYKEWLDMGKARVMKGLILDQMRVIRDQLDAPPPPGEEDDRTPEEKAADEALADELREKDVEVPA